MLARRTPNAGCVVAWGADAAVMVNELVLVILLPFFRLFSPLSGPPYSSSPPYSWREKHNKHVTHSSCATATSTESKTIQLMLHSTLRGFRSALPASSNKNEMSHTRKLIPRRRRCCVRVRRQGQEPCASSFSSNGSHTTVARSRRTRKPATITKKASAAARVGRAVRVAACAATTVEAPAQSAPQTAPRCVKTRVAVPRRCRRGAVDARKAAAKAVRRSAGHVLLRRPLRRCVLRGVQKGRLVCHGISALRSALVRAVVVVPRAAVALAVGEVGCGCVLPFCVRVELRGVWEEDVGVLSSVATPFLSSADCSGSGSSVATLDTLLVRFGSATKIATRAGDTRLSRRDLPLEELNAPCLMAKLWAMGMSWCASLFWATIGSFRFFSYLLSLFFRSRLFVFLCFFLFFFLTVLFFLCTFFLFLFGFSDTLSVFAVLFGCL